MTRLNRNRKGKACPAAMRANSDDPPIHSRPLVLASAGAEDNNPVGSSHDGRLSGAARRLDRKGFLGGQRQRSGDKGLSARDETSTSFERRGRTTHLFRPRPLCSPDLSGLPYATPPRAMLPSSRVKTLPPPARASTQTRP